MCYSIYYEFASYLDLILLNIEYLYFLNKAMDEFLNKENNEECEDCDVCKSLF